MAPRSFAAAIILIAIGQSSVYDQDEALKALAFAYGAFCDASDLRAWDCTWCQSNFDITSHGAGVIDTGDLQAFVGYDHDENRIVLSFRGSTNIANWLNNFEIALTSYPHFENGTGSVHSGFYSNWLRLEDAGLTTMIQSMFAGYPDADILITGHSLGGAMAQMAAFELKQDTTYNTLSIGSVDVITFGSPRWCDDIIASQYGKVVDSNWRVVNEVDIAPQVPLQIMGYHHTGTMVRYLDAASREYVECDESGEEHWTNPDCWYFGTSTGDHMWYFDVYATCDTPSSHEVFVEDPNVRPAFTSTMEGIDVFVDEFTNTEDTVNMIDIEIESDCNRTGNYSIQEAQLMIFFGLIIGWTLALFSCLFWLRARKELKRMTAYGLKVNDEISSITIAV